MPEKDVMIRQIGYFSGLGFILGFWTFEQVN